MAVRQSSAVWQGNLRDGKGTMRVGAGVFEGSYSAASRFEEGEGTNPEELIAAAHAGCFSMALAGILARAGLDVKRLETTARVTVEKQNGGYRITKSELATTGTVPGTDEKTFLEHASTAKENCPVSRALAGVQITLEAKLKG